MAGIPKNFDAISNVLPTYNFIDIISGTGYVNFYAGKTVDLNLLSNFTYYSDTVATSSSVNPGAAALYLDNDFDVLLNRPMDMLGLGIVNVPVFINDNKVSVYAVTTLRKWTGAVETDIVTNTSRTYTGGTNTYSMLAVDLTIPLTHFKKGEYIRLTIQIYGANSDGVAHSLSYAHDPESRSTGWDSTGAVPSKLVFQCPVRLNL